ncbi:MAG TPA: ankyrin repeat domain-containing protein, partial [Chthonomonadaceae bacterium]|nr:ankyrin repeat domain-containing protein [Chthonomonadaceae bacterium]
MSYRQPIKLNSFTLIVVALIAVIACNCYGRWRKAGEHRMLVAARSGDIATVRVLLRMGISPEGKTEPAPRPPLSQASDADFAGGETAVTLAAASGRTEVLKLLLDHGGNLQTRDRAGNTALTLAMQRRHHDAALLLLQRGADPNPVSDAGLGSRVSILSIAAERDWRDILKLALDRGDPPDGVPRWSRRFPDCPICAAAQAGHVEAARLLLDRGANTEGRDAVGSTPLMEAAQAGNIALMALLLRRGAHVSVRDDYDMTPLMWAAHSGKRVAVQLLLDNGADINARHFTGWTSLAIAARTGDPALVHFLLEKGADARGEAGSKALYAAEIGNRWRQSVSGAASEKDPRPIVLDLLT